MCHNSMVNGYLKRLFKALQYNVMVIMLCYELYRVVENNVYVIVLTSAHFAHFVRYIEEYWGLQ